MGNVAHADETKREATKARQENKGEKKGTAGEERREEEMEEEEASDREFREQSGLPTGALTDP